MIHDDDNSPPQVSSEVDQHQPSVILSDKPILKCRPEIVNDASMMDNILDYVSGDQLPSVMAAMQFHLDTSSENGDMPVSADRYRYDKLLQSYRRG